MQHVTFSGFAGLGSFHPDAPPEFKGTMHTFGFPGTMKHLHKSLSACVNRIPREDNLRNDFLKSLGLGAEEQSAVNKMVNKLGFASAMRDLQEKRITQMTIVDFIRDKRFDTPDAASVDAFKAKVLTEDAQRFAKVLPTKDGTPTNEWDYMDEERPEPT